MHLDAISLFGSCPVLSDTTAFLRMALMVYDTIIIHFHMDAARAVALGQSYFAHPYHLVVNSLTRATLLDPTVITQVGTPNVWGYAQIFPGLVGYMLNSTACHHIVVVLYSLLLHILTFFPFLNCYFDPHC